MNELSKIDKKKAQNILEVNNIEAVYNHVILVLKGVSLNVKKGGITTLLGGNGAGKTTTLKSISNLLASERGEVTKGSITFNNQDVHQLDPSQLVKMGVIQVMEGTAKSMRDNEDVKEFYLGISGEGRQSYRDFKQYRRRKRWL